MSDLTARLLAEIERRDRGAQIAYNQGVPVRDVILYLGALREIVEMHRPADDGVVCVLCGYEDGSWPCCTLRSVCGVVGIDWNSDCRVNQTRQTNEGQNNGR